MKIDPSFIWSSHTRSALRGAIESGVRPVDLRLLMQMAYIDGMRAARIRLSQRLKINGKKKS